MGSTTRLTRLCLLACVGLIGLQAVFGSKVAHTGGKDFDSEEYWRKGEEEKRERGYWHVALLGGVVVPTDTMSQVYKEGLAANVQVGYTARFGLGLTLGAEYSPLPARSTVGESGESHLVVLTACPRFTIGRETLRIWLGAGGGVAVEKANGIPGHSSTAELLAQGEAGLEMHLFSSGGLAVNGNYARSFGQSLDAKLFSVLGGLVFTFR
jgi:hypothetical protein